MKPFATLLAALALAGCQPQAPAEEQAAAPPIPDGVVALDPATEKALAPVLVTVERHQLANRHEGPGQIAARPEAEALVHAPVAGQVIAVHARAGDRLRAGAPLLTIRSAERAAAQAAYLKALGEARLAGKAHARQRQLLAAELASKQELDEAAQRKEAADLAVAHAAEGLRVLGYGDADLQVLAQRNRVTLTHVVQAPMAGTVIERHVSVGEQVTPTDAEPLFRLLDLSVVRVEAELPERDMLAVQPGQRASVSLAAMGEKALAGRVVGLSPLIDAATRTGKALVDVPNPSGALRPGMSARVSIEVGERSALAVPAAAVQEEAGKAYAYVSLGEHRFKETPLTIGARRDGQLEVLSGLMAGQTVVTQGSFDLRAQARKAQFGGD